MNPFILLFGLVGAGTLNELGELKKESGIKGHKTKDTSDGTIAEETVWDTLPASDTSTTSDTPSPDEPLAVDNTSPTPPDQSGDGGTGGATAPTALTGNVLEVMEGRVATLSAATEDVASIKILSDVEHGNVTVNPDNTFALVMTLSDFTGAQSFTYEVTHGDGSVTVHEQPLTVVPGLQDGGWGTGSGHYMLETDADDRVIVETGEDHVKVYISGASDALSKADIAALEGLSVDQITGDWLAASDYGKSEGMALDVDAGLDLWRAVTPSHSETSNWLLFERGYDYALGENEHDDGRLIERGADGEDELHPLYIGAYGEGDMPKITTRFSQIQESSENLVIQDIHFTDGVFLLNAENVIFDNVKLTEDGMAVQLSDSVTIRNSDFVDIYREDPVGDYWQVHWDRIAGLYMDTTEGVLIEDNFFDHVGWAPDYLEPDGGQEPSMFSHNMYLNVELSDVTLRDTISMRSSSFGAQVRSGGFIEDNAFIDNNVGFNFLGGDYRDAGPVGQYTLADGNLVTSAGFLEADMIGAKSMGIEDVGRLSTMVDNIIAHLADPNNPEEIETKYQAYSSLRSHYESYYDDTMIWNWDASKFGHTDVITEQNVEGLDTAVLDQTTIQIFTQQLLGDPNATITDLADYLRAQGDGAFDDIVDADLIIRFFQEGFGIAPDIRAEAETLRFVPDDLGDGVRWDNRLNWSTDDLPGSVDGDSVDLGGNHVIYGGTNEIDTLDLGAGGRLDMYHGKLTATGGLVSDSAGHINIQDAAQLWIDGASGAGSTDIDIGGGRFVNTGDAGGLSLNIGGGQTVLATDDAEFDLDDGETLSVTSSAAKVGFDGNSGGTAILDMHEDSWVTFSAEDGGLGTIGEFRTGAFGEETDVQSGIDLGGTTLEVDLTGLDAVAGSAFTLMDSDELVGTLNEAIVDGLGARDAKIVIDYANDSVSLLLSAGSGAVTVETLGEEDDVTAGEEALWDALTGDMGVITEAELPEMPIEADDPEQQFDVAA